MSARPQNASAAQLTLSPELRRQLGAGVEEVRWDDLKSRMDAQDRVRVDSAIRESCRLGGGATLIPFRLTPNAGETIRVLADVSVNVTQSGYEVGGTVSRAEIENVAVDVTGDNSSKIFGSTTELGRLQESNRRLSRFAHLVSHELQAPARTAGNFASLLQSRYRDQIDEDATDWIERLASATMRMQVMTRDLLKYCEIGGLELDWESTNVAELVERVISERQESITVTDADVTVDAMPTLPADKKLLTLVFTELLGNALTFHEGGPVSIQLSARRDEAAGEWVFTVVDRGIGIDPKCQENIFEPFVRLHARSKFEGAGLGLALAITAVQHWGGRIGYESVPDRGSEFFFTIPDRGHDGRG